MNYGRCYHLAYHHRKARVRKKNLHRFQRKVRKECKKGKTLIEVMPDQLREVIRNAPAMRDDKPYMCDHRFPPTKLPLWWGRQPEDPRPLFSIGGGRPPDYPYPFMNIYGNMIYHPPF